MAKVLIRVDESEEQDGQGKKVIVREPVYARIPPAPRRLSEFPPEAIAAVEKKPRAAEGQGLWGVVTLDGKKFYVEPEGEPRKGGGAEEQKRAAKPDPEADKGKTA